MTNALEISLPLDMTTAVEAAIVGESPVVVTGAGLKTG